VGNAHSHHHSHAAHRHPDEPGMAAASTRRILAGVVGAVALATLIGLAVWWPRGDANVDPTSLFSERVDATVTMASTGPCSYDASVECNTVTFQITNGPDDGATASIEPSRDTDTTASELEAGDDIVLNDAGADVPPEARYSFADVQRTRPLLLLALVFAAAVVAFGRLRGLLALAGIGVSLGVLLVYVFPALLHGSSPIGVALTGSAVIAFGTLYLAHGVSDRTTVALLGTFGSLLLTAGLAVGFARAAELSGLASEESITLLAFAPDLDFRGLLLAAVIIGALGVLDDVTITQVAAVWELHASDPEVGALRLYRPSIRIGRDHIASTVNTLILAYAAAALPLLLLYSESGLAFADVLASETIAVEIVQTLVGSIGLVASVPLTTAVACWVVTRRDEPDWMVEPPPRPPRPPRSPRLRQQG
jgi:uncharacterized membrane protein